MHQIRTIQNRKSKIEKGSGPVNRSGPLGFHTQQKLVHEAGLRGSIGLATTLAFAGVLAFAAIVASLATTLAFTIVLALAVMGAAIEVNRLGAGANDDGRVSSSDVLDGRSVGALGRASHQTRKRRDSQHAAGGTDQFGLLSHNRISSVFYRRIAAPPGPSEICS
jgi:hypothetical protein